MSPPDIVTPSQPPIVNEISPVTFNIDEFLVVPTGAHTLMVNSVDTTILDYFLQKKPQEDAEEDRSTERRS